MPDRLHYRVALPPLAPGAARLEVDLHLGGELDRTMRVEPGEEWPLSVEPGAKVWLVARHLGPSGELVASGISVFEAGRSALAVPAGRDELY